MSRERAVKREDIERYRRALTELGGEPRLEQLAEHAGTGETDLGYIMACLIVPAANAARPFAIPSAWGRDAEGRRLWRTEDRWTPDGIENGVRLGDPRQQVVRRRASFLHVGG